MGKKKDMKYKIINSFCYYGKEGKEKKGIIYSPGEELPELDLNEIERLLMQQKIAEVSQTDGSIIPYKKLENLDSSQIKSFLSKPYNFIYSQLKTRYFSNDTLSEIYSLAENMKISTDILKLIESKIDGDLV